VTTISVIYVLTICIVSETIHLLLIPSAAQVCPELRQVSGDEIGRLAQLLRCPTGIFAVNY